VHRSAKIGAVSGAVPVSFESHSAPEN